MMGNYHFKMTKEQVKKVKEALRADKEELAIFLKASENDLVSSNALREVIENRHMRAVHRSSERDLSEVERMYHEGVRVGLELVLCMLPKGEV